MSDRLTPGPRARAILPWSLFSATVCAAIVMVALAYANGPNTDEPGGYVLFGLMSCAYCGVGAFVLARRSHPIGWLFCGIGIAFAVANLMEQYAIYATVTEPGSLPVFLVGFPVGTLVFAFATTSLIFVVLLFPTGRLLGPRWRLVSRTTVIAAVVWAVTLTLRSADPKATVQNPLAIDELQAAIELLFGFSVAISFVCAGAAVAGLVLRFRRSAGTERQQLKWLAFFVVSAAALLLLGLPLSLVVDENSVITEVTWTGFFSLLMFGVPLAVGLAILRYRLYDIDRIVSRTVSYAIVTAILGSLFVLVTLVPTVVVGAKDSPDWVIALATLLVAGAARPVRRRVQIVIDRRFNRSRYDAEHTIETFTARLREEIDLNALGYELQDVIGRTMQPSHLFLWLRSTSR